jgi:hypothetical protein
MREGKRWLAVVVFAAAMAWMEAATVVYLRTLVGRLEPYQPNPLPLENSLAGTEIVREAATMVMLLAAAWLAGRTPGHRFGYWALAFGVWDILYYAFLAVIGPWPRSVWDWDVLFLIPLPWWGPVLAPTGIAALMVAGGTLVTQWGDAKRPVWPSRGAWALGVGGAFVALYVFMEDALRAASGGAAALAAVLPERFDWPWFLVALGLMAAPVLDALRQALRGAGAFPARDPEPRASQS